MKQWLYRFVGFAALLHDQILRWNDRFPTVLTDKQLHFLVVGVMGMLFFFILHPVFRWLIRHGHEIVISWFYVFTVILVLTFAVEIGQHVTHTGTLEFGDIAFGVVGFLFMFGIFAVIRWIVLIIIKAVRRGQEAEYDGPDPEKHK